MGTSYYTNPVIFLINTLFGLYILAIMLRFLFQWVGAEYHNPISQFLVKITHPPLKILRRIVPSVGKIDCASLVLMIGLQILVGIAIFLAQGSAINIGVLFVWAVTELITLLIDIFFFAVIIQVILSWVSPGTYNPATALLYSLTDPLLSAGRKIIPPMSGMDLSPLLILIGLQILKMLIIPPLHQMTALLS